MKPDRYERMIEKEYQKWLKGPQVKGWLSISRNLLARQYRAIRRVIAKCRVEAGQTRCVEEAISDGAHNRAIRVALKALARWRRGKGER